jgi:hypothetical protein
VPTALKNLTVETVSFVDRAAVRDPRNKSEPRRLLLWKAENSSEGDDAMSGLTQPADNEIPAPARRAVDEAIKILEPHVADDPRVQALADKLQAISDSHETPPPAPADNTPKPGASSDEDVSEARKAESGTDRLADALVKADLAKAAVGAAPENLILRKQLADSTRFAQAEYLTKVRGKADSEPIEAEEDGDELPGDLVKAAGIGVANDDLVRRSGIAKDSRSAQLDHLRRVSPAAAAAWEAAQAA